MKKVLIVYYSHTGSNFYLAQKLAQDLDADLAEIRPRGSSFPLQLFFSQFSFSLGITRLKFDIAKYARVVLVGPVWTGQLVAPLRDFLIRYKDEIRELHFLTCCGSKDEEKDDKYGYNNIFKRVREITGSTCKHCAALPIPLLLPQEKRQDGELIMATRLGDDNFNGEIADRYQEFVRAMA